MFLVLVEVGVLEVVAVHLYFIWYLELYGSRGKVN